jgi:hypothetical protein
MQRRQTKRSNQVGALLVFAAIFWPGAGQAPAPDASRTGQLRERQ